MINKPTSTSISFTTLLELSDDTFCTISNGKFQYVSPSGEFMWGYTAEELIGKKMIDYIFKDDQSKTTRAINRLIKGLSNVKLDNRVISKNGAFVQVAWSLKWDAREQVLYARARNTTEMLEKELQIEIAHKYAEKCSRQLENVLESLGDGFLSLDKSWNIIYVNSAAENLTGVQRGKIIGKNIWSVLPDTKQNLFFAKCNEAVETNRSVQFELYSDRYNKWFEIFAYPSAFGLSVCFRNISEKKFREEQLKIVNERFEFIARATSDVIWDWDIKNNKLYLNDTFTVTFGYETNAVTNFDTWTQNIHEHDRPGVLERKKEALKDSAVLCTKDRYRFKKINGTIAYVNERAYIIRNSQGKALRMIASLEDITSQIKSDEELVLAARRQLLLFHKSPTPKWIVDAGSIRFIEVNDAAVKHYGFTREEFKQMIIYDLIAPEERKRAKLLFEKLKETENYEYTGILKLRKKKGAVVDAEVTSHTLKIDGETHVMVVANDITDRLNAQKRNTQAIIEAQEEERNLIGKELHDNVNQLLTTAQLYLENIDDYGDHTEEFINKSIDIIRKSISEIRNLSKALITPDLIDFDFRDSLEGLISYYKYLKTFDITFNYNVSNNYFPSEMRLNIYRILQELLNNTVKYAKATLVTINVEETVSTLVIRYEDNGVGFDPEAKSTGIGIRNIKSRIDAFKGEITFDSALDKGLRVLIKLPFL